jgi:signal transduction histidine kinase
VQRLLRILALAAVYVLTARLGLMLDAVAGFATLVWAPTGIALVALLREGRHLWPGVFLGAFVVNAWIGAPLHVAAGIATGNTLEAVLGAAALSRVGFDAQLERVRDVVALLAVAVGSTIASATLGVASLFAGGIVSSANAAPTWRAWWVGDAIGDVILAPLLLTWSSPWRARLTRARLAEGVGAIAMALLTGFAVFVGDLVMHAYALFAPLVWAAVRLRQRGATLVVFVVSACAIGGTWAGHGPFVHAELSRGLLELQSFMGFVAAVTLLLGAAVAERDEARTVAQEAVKARDDFLAIASHELRTPLGALALQLGTIRQLIAKGEAVSADRVERSERQSERLAHLVTTLLDVSRVESGQLRVQPELMDLAALARDVVDRSVEEAKRAGCELRVTAPEPLWGAWDRSRLEQVLTNLLSNAFRHAGGQPVDVKLTTVDDSARLVVTDHGPGIPQERIEDLFGRYRRGDAARERGGLGLGLYISRHVVEAHGGRLEAHGGPGAGCEFIVVLPLRGYPIQDGSGRGSSKTVSARRG